MKQQQQTFTAIIDTPCPSLRLGILAEGRTLEKIEFLSANTDTQSPPDSRTLDITDQLQAYFKDPRTHFSIHIKSSGTIYQQQVWQALREIPSGHTQQYGQLAKQLSSSARAIGGACRANPTPIITPCHRIVAANGLGGFSGQSNRSPKQDKLIIKRWLINHEDLFSRH